MNEHRVASFVRTWPARSPRLWLLALATAWLPTPFARGDDPPKPAGAEAVLSLIDGGTVPGQMVESAPAGLIRWKAGAFAGPFEFPEAEVVTIRFPTDGKPTKAGGALGFELAGGDVLYGSLVDLDENTAGLDVARLGQIKVDRARLRRIFRWRDGSDLIYHGPNGLVGWREVAPSKPLRVDRPQNVPAPVVGFAINGDMNGPPPIKAKPLPPGPAWLEDGRRLQSTRDGSTIQADLGLPARARIEIELAWEKSPDFLLALGVSDDEATVARAFRLEVWDGQIVAVRETDKEADVVAVQAVDDGPGRVQLHLFLDQATGRLAIYSEDGEPLADLKLGGGSGETLTGVRLANIRNGLTLERLRVAKWEGETPRPVGAADARVQLDDGSTIQGKVERLDPATREFVVRRGDEVTRFGEARIDDLYFSRVIDAAPRPVRVSYHDGTQLGGQWGGVENGRIILAVAGIAAPLLLPQDGLRAVDVPGSQRKPRDKDERIGELQIDGLKILGHLADSGGKPGESPLAWQALAGGPPAPIKPGTSGRILYRTTPKSKTIPELSLRGNGFMFLQDPPPPRPAPAPGAVPAPAPAPAAAPVFDVVIQRPVAPPAAPQFRNPAIVIQRGNVGVMETPAIPSPPERLMPPARRSLYLRSGDIIPVDVVKIDAEGVWFKTAFSEGSFVPNARIKAVELSTEDPASIRLNKVKFERLLTLPRMQKGNPPKHLIRSTNGDILRGNLTSMDDKTALIEIRLEEKPIPRERISRIIWLHADETDPTTKPADTPTKPEEGTRVQAVRSDGVRLTFMAAKFAEGALMGQSDVLGDCRVKVQDLDLLLIGGSVEKEAVQLAYQNFKLQQAPEPKSALFERGELGEGGAGGTDSPMVGKPAPDFQLDLLGGGKFKLAENKGKVIVLDFWATWCGPCLEAMPQIDKVTREFADKGVQLIAVNLQETPAKINAMLERQGLKPTVVLDKDGAIAARYGANAIPQTVVIDREGKVTRLFIGGGPRLGDQLREALQALMPAAK